MVVHIDLIPYAEITESESLLRSMAEKLTTEKSSIEIETEPEEKRIIISFRFHSMAQGAAVSLIHSQLKLALWEGWEDICISFSKG
ncbi:MAG: hypothetical protein ACR2PT_22725 [Endozoicomonas sp.]